MTPRLDAAERNYNVVIYEKSYGKVAGGRGGEGKQHKVVISASSKEEAERLGKVQAERAGFRGGYVEVKDSTTPKLDAIADAVDCMVQDAQRLRERADALGARGDAQNYTDKDLRNMGARWLTLCKTTAEVRERARKSGMNRGQEAFIVDGWKYARKVEGLSENV